MVLDNALYLEDVKFVAKLNLNWEKFRNANFLISGASGLIGSFLVDVLMYRNKNLNQKCKIYALGRNLNKARERFCEYINNPEFEFIAHDINLEIKNLKLPEKFDFVLHLASNTHPLDYASDPVGTITTNIIGLNNMLKFANEHNAKRFLFASSVEVYGENRGDTEFFDENYCGYIDLSKARSGYTESKRCGETLCLSYIQQYGLDAVIARLPRTYGPTMQKNDTKAVAQFIRKGASHEDIVLKSSGTQLFSYAYVADSVSAIFTVLINGKNGEAYNIADRNSDITLRELAELTAKYSGTKVIFEIPEEHEKKGYSMATKAIMNAEKINALGWRANYNIENGIKRTLDIFAN